MRPETIEETGVVSIAYKDNPQINETKRINGVIAAKLKALVARSAALGK